MRNTVLTPIRKVRSIGNGYKRPCDKYGGGISRAAIESFSRDVFLYTTRAEVREEIDRIVANSLTEKPTVMVGHSLGSVGGYSVLPSDRGLLHLPLSFKCGRH